MRSLTALVDIFSHLVHLRTLTICSHLVHLRTLTMTATTMTTMMTTTTAEEINAICTFSVQQLSANIMLNSIKFMTNYYTTVCRKKTS